MKTTVFDNICSIIRETFDSGDISITAGTVANDIPGWDSLSHAILLMTIENFFNVKIDNHGGFINVGDLAQRVSLQLWQNDANNNAASSTNSFSGITNLGQNDIEVSELLCNKDVTIKHNSLNYACRMRTVDDAKYLSVQLHGDRSGKNLPLFARWNYGNVLGAHVLSITDPTLYLSENLDLGWYIGTKEQNATEGIVEIALRCAKAVGIPCNKIIFSGSSGGGFAAIQAAAMMPEGKAIAINPQTDITKHLIRGYLENISGCKSIEEGKLLYGCRWNAIEALESAISAGRSPKILYVQNINDTSHFTNHFMPFAKNFTLPTAEGDSVNDNFMAIIYAGPSGHVAESSAEIRRINESGIPFLLGIRVVSDNPLPSTKVYLTNNELMAVVEGAIGNKADCEYACYLYHNNSVIEQVWYQAGNTFNFTLKKDGPYKCRGYIRNKNGDKYGIDSLPVTFKSD